MREIRISISLFLLLALLTGLAYPMAILGIGQVLFPNAANGSLIEDNGAVIGSSLIGQNFTDAIYFHGRPSAAGNGYDAANSSGSNLAPSSTDLSKAVGERVAAFHNENGKNVRVPADIITASASGLDPDISIEAAIAQVNRVAAARQMPIPTVSALISETTKFRALGIFGENRVNVLELNRALDQAAPMKKQ